MFWAVAKEGQERVVALRVLDFPGNQSSSRTWLDWGHLLVSCSVRGPGSDSVSALVCPPCMTQAPSTFFETGSHEARAIKNAFKILTPVPTCKVQDPGSTTPGLHHAGAGDQGLAN